MSSILKALKKVEDDKAACQPDELKIDADILRTDNYPRFSSTSVLLSAILLMACGSGATYMYMNHTKTTKVALTNPPSLHRQTVVPALMPSDIKTEQLPDAIVVAPATQQKSVRMGAVKQPQAATALRTSANTSNTSSATRLKTSNHDVQAKESPSGASSVTTSVTEVPFLRVNGIAFQSNGTDSLAIVNGTPVSSGSIIEGVTVVEVRKDRVMFKRNEEKFDIQMGQSNR